MADIHRQLEMFGLEECVRRARLENSDKPAREVKRIIQTIQAAHSLLSEPTEDYLTFLHSGLCQAGLPHRRPDDDSAIWHRSNGRFHLMVSPGQIIDPKTDKPRRVGVPYGTRARLIMMYLQTEGRKDRTINLGRSMSAWIRSLGLSVTGGRRGNIAAIKEQALRIARCEFTMQWDVHDAEGSRTIIRDQRIVDGLAVSQLSLWDSEQDEKWTGIVHLSKEFHEHLKEHSVPLDKRAITHLSDNSLGLDLYALFAHRLHRLERPLMLTWAQLMGQIGADFTDLRDFGKKANKTLPRVLAVYPDAKVESTRGGLILKPSPPPIPKQQVFLGGGQVRLVKK